MGIVKRTLFPELYAVQLLFAYFNIRMSTKTQNEISRNGFKLFRIFRQLEKKTAPKSQSHLYQINKVLFDGVNKNEIYQ